MPKASIAIAVYNGAADIERALCSVKAQTFRDFEVLLVDDGSTDGTLEIVAKYPWVRVIRQEHLGVGAARARLVAEAQGEWVAFLDHDDELAPSMLAALLEATSSDVVLVHGAKRIRDGVSSSVVSWQPPVRATVLDHLLPDNRISNSAVIVRRSAAVGAFDGDLRRAEDWLAWFRIGAKGEFRCVSEVVATIYKRADSTSRPGLEWYEAERRVLEQEVLPNLDVWYSRIANIERYRRVIRRKLGIIASLEAEALDSRGERVRSRTLHLAALKAAPTKGALWRFLRHLGLPLFTGGGKGGGSVTSIPDPSSSTPDGAQEEGRS